MAKSHNPIVVFGALRRFMFGKAPRKQWQFVTWRSRGKWQWYFRNWRFEYDTDYDQELDCLDNGLQIGPFQAQWYSV